MIHRQSILAAGAALLAAAAFGCSDAPALKPMQMDGVAELPASKVQQVATYRCSVDLRNGHIDVNPGRRAGKEEETAWKNLSSRLKQDRLAYEVLIEQSEKNAKGGADWALVTVLETEADSGKLIRKFPVYEFWGSHDRGLPRALMVKDGRLQFFVQFWPAD